MIKIEFKEGMNVCSFIDSLGGRTIKIKTYYPKNKIRCIPKNIESITFGCPSELVPDRSEILKQLGISQQEDEQNQIKWSKLI